VKALLYVVDWLTPKEDKMPSLKLEYFDMKGLAEPIRQVLNYANIKFEDCRLSSEEFAKSKESFKFKQMPVMTVNGEKFAQSKALLRYVGRLTRTYPSRDKKNALVVDEWLELHSEFIAGMVCFLYPSKYGLDSLTDEQKATQRQFLSETFIPRFLAYLDDELYEDQWLGGVDSPSVADFAWLSSLEWITSGIIDGVDKDCLDGFPWVKRFRMRSPYGQMEESVEIEEEDENFEDSAQTTPTPETRSTEANESN
jgi:glutathione S-transferase